MIGLSPLSTGHPLRFQPKWVRPSTGSYPRFSLPMDSSPGFASAACDSIAILKARFHCGSVQTLTSPHTATRWLILQKARRHPARGLRLLVGARFQVLFHSPLGVLFTFPSRYSYAIGQTGILRLTRRSGRIHTGFHESRATRETPSMVHAHTATGPSPSPARYPTRFASRMHLSPQPTASAIGQAFPRHHARNPRRVSTHARFSHHPLSLATTHGVSSPAGTEMFHFPAYPPRKTRCQPMTAGGLPHSDTLGSKPCRRLPQDYRGPTRPSSVLSAKASTIRPSRQPQHGRHDQSTTEKP